MSKLDAIKRVFEVFKNSKGVIRPHCIVVGSSGSGKTYTIQQLVEALDLNFLEINAAQLTKEGNSGNSLSKALTPMLQNQNRLTVCFVDEFDKLFISGNSNSMLAHENTNGVQNEFLKVLESETTSVYGDYGKYLQVKISTTLFVFAGAFNGEKDITINKLKEFGLKTEFLGRVGLIFNIEKLTLEELLSILKSSELLKNYLKLFPKFSKDECIDTISKKLMETHEDNIVGARAISTLIHYYFINDGVIEDSSSDAPF